MTAVMRAVARPAGARVLRAALVRGGKVVDERILPQGAHLTVGPSEHATFVITGPKLRNTVRLIESADGGYRLLAAPGATGRVARGAQIVDLDSLGAEGSLPLGDDARGKVAIGDSVVLFHFVDPPVAPPRAQLPLAVQKGVFDGLDWKTTFIAAFSFLFHFGAAGAVYSDWADGVVDDDVRVAHWIEIIKEITPPPIETAKPIDDDKATTVSTKDVAVAQPKTSVGRSTGPAAGGASGGGRMSESKAKDLARQLDEIDGAMVTAIGARSNGAVARVLETGGDLPIGMIDDLARSAGGNRPGDNNNGLKLNGDGGGAIKPGLAKGGCGLTGCADTRADKQAGDSGKAAEVKKPVGNTSVQPPEVNGGRVSDAARVVAGMRGQFRACYKHGMDEDPNMRGSVRVTASIAPNGDVRSVQTAGSGLSSAMISCVTRVVRGAQFSPPEGGGATLVIPISFYPQ
jgi:TonB family protein